MEKMSSIESFRDRVFLVSDPDARIRNDSDLLAFATYKPGDTIPQGSSVGDPKRIPQGTQVRVSAIKVVPTGSRSKTIFARATSANGDTVHGWTSTRNFDGRFVNETLGSLPPTPGAGQYGANAAWSKGGYLGQVDLVEIVDNGLEIERLTMGTIEPYFAMVAAAKASNVTVAINSGFRSYPEQKFLWEGFNRGLPGFNTAAKPGYSNHQNGIALDIAVVGGTGNPTYDWLVVNATAFGFLRTVSGEPWHWEYDPPKAEAARNKGTFRLPGVSD